VLIVGITGAEDPAEAPAEDPAEAPFLGTEEVEAKAPVLYFLLTAADQKDVDWLYIMLSEMADRGCHNDAVVEHLVKKHGMDPVSSTGGDTHKPPGALAAAFGEVETHLVAKGLPGFPQILEIQRERGAEIIFGEEWHSDHSFQPLPAAFSFLRATAEVTPYGARRRLDRGAPARVEV